MADFYAFAGSQKLADRSLSSNGNFRD